MSSPGCTLKITLRIPLTDEVRRYIGAQFSPQHRTNKTGMAYRKACRTWLEMKVTDALPALEKLAPPPEPPALTDDEKKALVKVIDYLRAQGHSDQHIEAWVLLQRARNLSTFRSTRDRHPSHP